MNVETGHLVRDIESIDPDKRADYERLSADLEDLASQTLGDADETVVDLKAKDSPLARWARKRRRDKKRSRRAIAKASRRRNRK